MHLVIKLSLKWSSIIMRNKLPFMNNFSLGIDDGTIQINERNLLFKTRICISNEITMSYVKIMIITCRWCKQKWKREKFVQGNKKC